MLPIYSIGVYIATIVDVGLLIARNNCGLGRYVVTHADVIDIDFLIARLLAQEARILLLDEPTANLDISHRSRVFTVARDLTSKGHTVLAAIHDLNEASLHCSRLILLSEGRIAARGTPEEVLRPEILHAVYRVPTVVSRSPATGALLVEIAP